MGRSARRKGHDFERWVANIFAKIYSKAKRHLEYQKSEANGIDIENTGPFKIQCKRYKTYAPINCIEEVSTNNPDDIPLLITKGDRKRAVVCLYLEDFTKIITDIGEAYDKPDS